MNCLVCSGSLNHITCCYKCEIDYYHFTYNKQIVIFMDNYNRQYVVISKYSTITYYSLYNFLSQEEKDKMQIKIQKLLKKLEIMKVFE